MPAKLDPPSLRGTRADGWAYVARLPISRREAGYGVPLLRTTDPDGWFSLWVPAFGLEITGASAEDVEREWRRYLAGFFACVGTWRGVEPGSRVPGTPATFMLVVEEAGGRR